MTPTNRNRRRLIVGTCATLAVLGAADYIASTPEDAVVMMIASRLNYLQLDMDGLRQYARDIHTTKIFPDTKFKLVDAVSPVYRRLHLSSANNRVGYALRHGEDRLITTYLMSTDFFKNGADESKVLQYLGLFNQQIACSNPFARIMVS